jgi:hypothetical protein
MWWRFRKLFKFKKDKEVPKSNIITTPTNFTKTLSMDDYIKIFKN